MPPFNSKLLNSLITVNTPGINRSTFSKAGIVEATVLSSTPLPITQGTKQSFQINIQLNQKVIEIISQENIKPGSIVQLKSNPDNTATLILVTDNKEGKQSLAPQTQLPRSTNSPTAVTAPQSPATTKTTHKNHPPSQTTPTPHKTADQPAIKITETKKSIIETGIRQSLPIQQPLKALLPLLIQLTQQQKSDIPKSIVNTIKTLTSQLPTKENLREPKAVKRAILNSGTFLEAKLSTLISEQLQRSTQRNKLTPAQLSQQPTQEHYQRREGAVIHADTKAKTLQLIREIEQVIGKPLLKTNALATKTSSDVTKQTLEPTPPLQTNTLIPNTQHIDSTQSAKNDNIDILLQQLGKQLLATLAKTQLNQLDTLNQRGTNTTENTTIINSWALDIPIMTGKNADNLELHINEEELENEKQEKTKQWKVMLDFDLHSLGKMSVELVIIEKTVSATVWSEKEQAHLTVKKEIDSLRSNLESAGVNVKKVDCLLGIPKKRVPLKQQLVDIRT